MISTGRIAVLADVHANSCALEAVLLHASKQNVDKIWYLGDAVGYGPDPQRCLKLLMDNNVTPKAWILGNNDEAMRHFSEGRLLNPEGDINGDRLLMNLLDPLTMQIGTSDDTCKSFQINYDILEAFPDRLDFLLSRTVTVRIEQDFFLVHGGLRHENPTCTYTYNTWDVRDEFSMIKNLFRNSTPNIYLAGHTHIPMCCKGEKASSNLQFTALNLEPGIKITMDEHCWFLNPGSVGQPRDGDNRASYMIVDRDESYVQFHKVEYNIKATQKRMEELQIPENLINRLDAGR